MSLEKKSLDVIKKEMLLISLADSQNNQSVNRWKERDTITLPITALDQRNILYPR